MGEIADLVRRDSVRATFDAESGHGGDDAREPRKRFHRRQARRNHEDRWSWSRFSSASARTVSRCVTGSPLASPATSHRSDQGPGFGAAPCCAIRAAHVSAIARRPPQAAETSRSTPDPERWAASTRRHSASLPRSARNSAVPRHRVDGSSWMSRRRLSCSPVTRLASRSPPGSAASADSRRHLGRKARRRW